MESMEGDSIQVFIRIKPGGEESSIVHVDNEIRLQKHQFGFDKVFSKQAQQEDIFNAVGKKLISNTIDGYNGCVFVYGQTGSGKTYTMIGESNGLMQRSFIQLFSRINRMPNCQWIITCSYYELYNEQIIDLLDPKKDKKLLNIRHDIKKGVFVQNLTEETILNSDRLMECLNFGMKNRHIGETMMNRQSSRSHSIFTLSLSCKTQIEGKKILKTPKLHFVDLAGSERQKLTMATGERLKEAGNINKSLTTLGMVINALASQKTRLHIPYRDSKLTTLLRDSLGGNSKTFIVATISTSILCFQQTLSTLNFANRAKMVKVKALINEQSLSNNIEHYKDEIKRLKMQILRLKSQKRVNFQPQAIGMSKSPDIEHHFEQINNKISMISDHLKSTICSPTLQNLVHHLENRAPLAVNRNQQPVDNRMEDQNCQNQLLEYLSSNYELLSQINKKMNEYIEVKDDLRNIAFNKKLSIQQIKTPSKFERDQYEQLLSKREEEIKELEESLAVLKKQYTTKENQNKDLRRKIHSIEHDKTTQCEIDKLKHELSNAYKDNDEASSNYSLLMEQKLKLLKINEQLENRLKQVKQLYEYSEEKYQNQKYSKAKLQNYATELSSKLSEIKEEYESQMQQGIDQIQLLKDKIQDLQSKEEQHASQIQVLLQTSQFNQKIINQYTLKITEQKKELTELNKNKIETSEQFEHLKAEYDQYKSTAETDLSVLKVQSSSFKRKAQTFQKDNTKVRKLLSDMSEEYTQFKSSKQEQIAQLQQKASSIQCRYNAINSQYQKHKVQQKKSHFQFERKVFQQQQQLTLSREQNMILHKEKKHYQDKLTYVQKQFDDSVEFYRNLYEKDQKELLQCREKITTQEKKIEELDAFINRNKNIFEEHENIKKAYMDIVKENYKLKGEYAHSSSTFVSQSQKNEELISKVAYYEEKFKLMSIQYNKATQIIKKMKLKELSLLKKVSFFEENQKNKRVVNHAENDQTKQESLKLLQQENEELKLSVLNLNRQIEEITKNDQKHEYLKKCNLQTQRMDLQQKENQIRKRLQNAIKTWGQSKENNCVGTTLDELFTCWQKIQKQSLNKLQTIERGIKKEQKLKSQNNFILKENFHLKEQLNSLQKQLAKQSIGLPRKMVKTQ